MKIAIIPWASQFGQDKMFDINDKVINRDHLMEPYYEMQQYFKKNGDELHTIDVYDSYEEIDYFLFFEVDWFILKKLVRLKKADRMIYCNAEPPVVNKLNTPEGYMQRSNIFPYFMTWNDDWVDNVRIFKKNIPYHFEDDRDGMLPFADRKLVTFISGFKRSSHPDELYSERERAIEYFQDKCPEQFDFYGAGWPEADYKCYKGKAANKAEVFHRYKFAICYENMKNISGYITEKILDCLTSGIVPIYAGATNIDKVVPRECFIARDQFSSYDELYKYITAMTEDEYNSYLDSAKRFLCSDKREYFEGSEYARCVYNVIEHHRPFKVSLSGRIYICQRIASVKKKMRRNKKK